MSLGKASVKARGMVETWLGQVESAMVASLRRLAKVRCGRCRREGGLWQLGSAVVASLWLLDTICPQTYPSRAVAHTPSPTALQAGMASYPEQERNVWVLQQPAQLVLAISQVFWAADVEACLAPGQDPAVSLPAYFEVGVPAGGQRAWGCSGFSGRLCGWVGGWVGGALMWGARCSAAHRKGAAS